MFDNKMLGSELVPYVEYAYILKAQARWHLNSVEVLVHDLDCIFKVTQSNNTYTAKFE